MVDNRTTAVVAVVEDDASSRTALGRLLRAEGFTTALFESAEAFIAASFEGIAACLVADLQLPGMSGLELQQRLRASGSHLPVIIITGAHETRLRDRAVENGCAAFFYKPLESDLLVATIASLASRCTKVQ